MVRDTPHPCSHPINAINASTAASIDLFFLAPAC